jgi:hypothetical protein
MSNFDSVNGITLINLSLPQPCDAFNHQVITGERARLVEATDVNLASKGDAERLRTVHN